MFIRKAYEDKTVNETTLIRNSVFNAISNAFRGKGKAFHELWNKANPDDVNVEDDVQAITEIENNETNWLDDIYRNAGVNKPKQQTKGDESNG